MGSSSAGIGRSHDTGPCTAYSGRGHPDVLELATEEVNLKLIRMFCMPGSHLVMAVVCVCVGCPYIAAVVLTCQAWIMRVFAGRRGSAW